MARKKIRYAVIGLGHFAQNAVLPAFANAKNSKLVALVSDDAKKLRKLGKEYDVEHRLDYDQMEPFFRSGEVDAVYIVTPNSLHAIHAIAAARAGLHVLCEKPMAVDIQQCEEMIAACQEAKVKLMIAYRLHFERANLDAVKMLKKKKIGEPRLFLSGFSFQVTEGNIRTRPDLGGGPLFDIGVYCINAARYLFRDEPIEVTAMVARNDKDSRFEGIEEGVVATLRFPGDRLATFGVSFNAADSAWYEVLGTKGRLRVEPAYEYAGELGWKVTVGDKTRVKTIEKRDQIGPEIEYFSDCIRKNREPEPSGVEGLADVRIVQAIFRAAETGRTVEIGGFEKRNRPEPRQERKKKPVEQRKTVDVQEPHQ